LEENKKKKLEVYIHIPFCIKKCNYCDFLSFSSDPDIRSHYFRALLLEMDSFFQSEEYRNGNYEITSVFLGGGTPSLLEAEWIGKILSKLPANTAKEITIEANPGTLSAGKLSAYREFGINRLSFGVQSSDNAMLKRLGRIHTWEEFLENYEQARLAGFENINLDIMSGLPGQTKKDWEKVLEEITKLSPEHISAYSLILEEGTPFFSQYGQHPELLPTEDAAASMYELTGSFLSRHGYRQYEISNYAKPGYECSHNLGYWYRTEYIGFGLGAASLWQETRFRNTEHMGEYLAVLEMPEEKRLGAVRREYEVLSEGEQMEEMMILGLRCRDGVSADGFLEKFGKEMMEIYGNVISRYGGMGFLEWKKGRLCLTKKALLVSNEIMQGFML
jgi:oxygen-independent coproporphyrinogen-3 oxidase